MQAAPSSNLDQAMEIAEDSGERQQYNVRRISDEEYEDFDDFAE